MPDKAGAHTGHSDISKADLTRAAVEAAGLAAPVNPDDLVELDLPYLGGSDQIGHLLRHLRINVSSQVLEIGCGLGGVARMIAKRTGARVTGIEPDAQLAEAARLLNGMCLMLDRVAVRHGDPKNLPLDKAGIDVAYAMYPGLCCDRRQKIFQSAARVLRRGGLFALFDVVPGASSEDNETEWVAADATQKKLAATGLRVMATHERTRDIAIWDQTRRSAPHPYPRFTASTCRSIWGRSLSDIFDRAALDFASGKVSLVEFVCRKS